MMDAGAESLITELSSMTHAFLGWNIFPLKVKNLPSVMAGRDWPKAHLRAELLLHVID